MSRIYQSVTGTVSGITSYLPFGRKATEPAKTEDDKPADELDKTTVQSSDKDKTEENGKHPAGENEKTANGDKKNNEDEPTELPSNKKTDEVYDPQSQPGFLRRAAGGVYNTATGAVSLGVGGVKWVGSTAYNTTSAVVTTTTGAIKKVPQVVKRKDKKE